MKFGRQDRPIRFSTALEKIDPQTPSPSNRLKTFRIGRPATRQKLRAPTYYFAIIWANETFMMVTLMIAI